MKNTRLAVYLAAVLLFEGQVVLAQTSLDPPSPVPSPIIKTAVPPTRVSATLAANLNLQTTVSQENRQQAYAKMLEGQRYMLAAGRQRTASASAPSWALAKQSFQKAVELNPNLAEGYVVLAELALTTPPGDLEETIGFSTLAIRVQPNNFGGHRFLAFAHTIKSGLNHTANPDVGEMEKAAAEWKTVTKISPRFAEGWAFLSEIYDKTNKTNERIEALKKWQASAAPVDTRFYRSIMGGQASLAPDSMTLKLGAALVKANRSNEAIEVLSEAISDDPDNTDAIDLLKQAVDNGDGKTSPATLQALQQAVYANPSNIPLIELLANAQSRNGKTDDAAKSLRSSIAGLMKSDKGSAASLQISLGDIYAGANRNDEAVAAYEGALKIQGIDKTIIDTEENREFATRVFGKMIQAYKNAGKINEAKSVIQRARVLLGNDDLFADKQIISLLRETGRKQEALQAVRALRRKIKDDYSLLRLEASLLTDLGQVDEGVKLVKTLIINQPIKTSSAVKAGQTENGFSLSRTPPSPYYDDFTNYIFISSLYNQAKRGTEAVETAKQAFAVAESEEKKQLANLSLATAQQTAGNYQSAEETLRGLLKKSPGNPVALNNLGYFLLERNEKFEEALSLIRQALEIDPTNASYLDSLGWAYFKLGKLGEAESYLKEAARNDLASATVFEHLGDVYQKQQKFELARAAWQKAINISSNSESESRLKEKLASRTAK